MKPGRIRTPYIGSSDPLFMYAAGGTTFSGDTPTESCIQVISMLK